ncbi:hypothetical protein [Anaerobiospirillum sp. NML120449]|uniref:hypothetical protein n=1 Tax=Anaerobiospirillum sp. NML120449 TaxID=2932817 RepID=UPI001FF4D96B|nr:hypothetical protein [Anaerobiospirillum sp. NML120449]MCK0526602.1 hypothetical protein [Anaerobiospirillum sp. NML120449]
MRNVLKLTVVAAVAASSFAVFAAPAPAPAAPAETQLVTAPHPAFGNAGDYYGQGPAMGPRNGTGPRAAAGECPHLNGMPPAPGSRAYTGPRSPKHVKAAHGKAHHLAHLTPHMGPGAGKALGTWCPQHNTFIAECAGEDFNKVFKADFDQLQALKDQEFIKKQILKARIADGDNAATITRYAQDVNTARRAVRDFDYQLRLKIRDYVKGHIEGPVAGAAPVVPAPAAAPAAAAPAPVKAPR